MEGTRNLKQQNKNQSEDSKKFSIEDLMENIEEKVQVINTPRSIQACKWEGISSKFLLYRPPEDFQQISLNQKVQLMHYEFFEKKRKNLIKKVYQAKIQLNSQDQKNFSLTLDNEDYPNFNSSVQFSKTTRTVTRAQQKQFRQIENMLRNEENLYSKFEQQQKQNQEKAKKLKEEEQKQAEIEKQKNAEQRLREIKKKQVFELKDKEREKNEQNLFKKTLVEQKKVEELEYFKMQEVKKRR